MFLYVLSMSLSSARYNFKLLRCLFPWSYDMDPLLGWLLLAKWLEQSVRVCVVWGTEYNLHKWKEWGPEDMFCPLWVLSDVLIWERVWVRFREAGRKPVPFPPRHGMLSFSDASQDRLFWAAPSSGMCLIKGICLAGMAALHELLPPTSGGSEIWFP